VGSPIRSLICRTLVPSSSRPLRAPPLPWWTCAVASVMSNLERARQAHGHAVKPDGGELYVISPEAHVLQAITRGLTKWRLHGARSSRPLAARAQRRCFPALCPDTAPPPLTPVDIYIAALSAIPAKLSRPCRDSPSSLRFDPEENLLLVGRQGAATSPVIRYAPIFW